MASGLNDYLEFIREGVRASGPFRPTPYYSADSDSLFFYARDAQSYAKRINSVLTVFLATDTEKVIGFRVKGVQRILKTMRALGEGKFVMDDRGIRLMIFIQLARVVPPDDPALQPYEDALDQYQDVIVDKRELQLA